MRWDDYLAELDRWRTDRDRFFAEHYATPLTDEAIEEFEALRYFPPNKALVVTVELTVRESTVVIEASTGTVSDYPGAGIVEVTLPVGSATLQVLHGEDEELFIPFRDATSGSLTYGGGRYVPVTPEAAGRHIVDFNRAINPYCAYDPDFSCPLPPATNWLPFPIEAGELDFP